MEKVRKIDLTFYEGGDEDNTGYTYYFDNPQAFGFIQNIAGLGFTLEDEFNKYGNRFLSAKTELSQVPVTFTLYLPSYERYNEMVQRIVNSKFKCQINYRVDLGTTKGQVTYNKDVKITNFTKGEKNIFGYIAIEVEAKPLTFWYRYVQPSGFYLASTVSYTSFTNDSQLPAEIKFSVVGNFTDLQFAMLGDDIETKRMNLINNTTISSTESLRYSSEDGDSYIKKINAQGVETDLMTDNHISINNANIFKIPPFQTVRLGFRATITGTKPISLKIKKFYVSV